MAGTNPIPPILSAEDACRFWDRVQVGAPDECWPWMRGCFDRGYGAVFYDGRLLKAHRVALLLITGEWPEVAMHSCDNPVCCNAATHVRAGTVHANVADRNGKGRTARGNRHRSYLYPDQRPRGERMGHAKLTDALVRWIRSEAANGRATGELARQVGVTRRVIYLVVRRLAWRHVD